MPHPSDPLPPPAANPLKAVGRDALTLGSGTVVAQALSFFSMPILTRLYTPGDFGLFALFTAVINLPTIIACGRYEFAIVLPETDEDALNVALLGFKLCVLTSLLFSLAALLLFGLTAHHFESLHPVRPWLWMAPFGVFLLGTNQLLVLWATRHQRFRALAASRISLAVTYLIIALLSRLWHPGATGLILASLASTAVAMGVLLERFVSAERERFPFSKWSRQKQLAKIYSDFPKINLAHAAVDMIESTLTSFLLSSWYGPAVLGAFSLANRTLRVPTNLIAGSFSQVLLGRLASGRRSRTPLGPLVRPHAALLGGVALVVFLPAAILAPTLFPLFFGPQWLAAGTLASALALPACAGFVASALSQIPIVLQRQPGNLAISFLGSATVVGTIAVATHRGLAPLQTVGLAAGAQCGFLLLSLGWFLWLVRNHDRELGASTQAVS